MHLHTGEPPLLIQFKLHLSPLTCSEWSTAASLKENFAKGVFQPFYTDPPRQQHRVLIWNYKPRKISNTHQSPLWKSLLYSHLGSLLEYISRALRESP